METISREISSLIAQGVSIEAYAPDYYYTKLDDVKMGLIEKASADARLRAEKIAVNAGAKIGSVSSARMGVFQITGANSNESSRPEGRSTPPTATRRPASPCGSNIGYDDRSRHCAAIRSGRCGVMTSPSDRHVVRLLAMTETRQKNKTRTNC